MRFLFSFFFIIHSRFVRGSKRGRQTQSAINDMKIKIFSMFVVFSLLILCGVRGRYVPLLFVGQCEKNYNFITTQSKFTYIFICRMAQFRRIDEVFSLIWKVCARNYIHRLCAIWVDNSVDFFNNKNFNSAKEMDNQIEIRYVSIMKMERHGKEKPCYFPHFECKLYGKFANSS